MQVINRLDPKLISSQFYSQIQVARLWVQSAIQDLMDTGAVEYTPGDISTCTHGCKDIVRQKRNTSEFPCSTDYAYSEPHTGLACDPLMDIYGARFETGGWYRRYLIPACASFKASFDAQGWGWLNLASGSHPYGPEFLPQMQAFYDNIDWEKCSRSLSSCA